MLEIKILSNGWMRIKIPGTSRFGGWAQIPIHYCEETIPDKYIFEPEWNRERINKAWRNHFQKELDRNEALHQQMGVDGWQEIYANAPSEEDIRNEMAEDDERERTNK